MANFFEEITKKCEEYYEEKSELSPVDMAVRIMAMKEFPMHSPHHHYLVPAVLLTASCIAEKKDEKTFQRYLSLAKSRAVKLPGGTCGEYGACSAAIGAGVFASVWTNTNPCSMTLGLVNQVTARGLEAIGGFEGARCCKRHTFLVLQIACEFAEEKLGICLKKKKPICGFFNKNEDCIHENCCFYPKK